MSAMLALQCGAGSGVPARPTPAGAASCSRAAVRPHQRGARMRHHRRSPCPPARVGFAGPTLGGSFDDEDDAELAESAESAVGGLRLPGSSDSPPPRARAASLLSRLLGAAGGTPAVDAAPPAFDPSDPSGARARALLAFVQNVSPSSAVEAFHATAPPDAVDAARRVAAALVSGGAAALPSAFSVSVSADGPAVADLLYSACLSGYLLKNAAARLELDRLLSPAAAAAAAAAPASSAAPPLLPGGAFAGLEPLPAAAAPPRLTPADVAAALATGGAARSGFAPGVQADERTGTVTKWHEDAGPVRLDAGSYISALEAALERARLQLAGTGAGWAADEASPAAAAAAAATWPLASALGGPAATSATAAGNALLGLIRTADAATLAGLTASASPGVLEAANTFCGRLLGRDAGRKGGGPRRFEYAAPDLAALVLLCLIVGWGLRSLEARFDLDAAMA